jgi:hypothetical protein
VKIFILFLLFMNTAVLVHAQTETPKRPSFRMDTSSKHKLVEKAAALRRGNSYQTVIAALGKATFDLPLVRKEDGRKIGRSLKYYAVVWETGLVNELLDELVDVALDENDRVRSVLIKVTLE